MIPDCCCASGYCTLRQLQPDATYKWSAPGDDRLGYASHSVAFDASNNSYLADCDNLIKLDPSGVELWRIKNPFGFFIYAVAVDSANGYGYFGTLGDPFSPVSSVVKFDLADGHTLGGSAAAGGANRVVDFAIDADGGVYVASVGYHPEFGPTGTLIHLDSSMAQIGGNVGCQRDTYALAIDDDFNLYAVGPAACSATVKGCTAKWNVLKFDNTDTLINGTHFYSAIAVAWYGGKLFVGYSGKIDKDALDNSSPIENFCTLVALDDTTLLHSDGIQGCLWTARLEHTGETEPPHPFDQIVDLAATADGVYACARKFLYKVDPSDGSLIWARKNEAADSDPDHTVRSANYLAVAANADFVWVAGGATPCAEGTNDDAESDSCSDSRCTCTCRDTKHLGGSFDLWNTGKDGGFIVDGCGCREVPCTAKLYMSGGDCIPDLPAYINTTRTFTASPAEWSEKWTGSTTISCGSSGHTWALAFAPKYLCGTGWSMDVTITQNFGSHSKTFAASIDSTFCDGIDGHPGFTWSLTISGSDFTDLGLDECCASEVALCGGFGDTGCGVSCLGCDSLPRTIHLTVTNVSGCACIDGFTMALTWTGDKWEGSGVTPCGATLTFKVNCSDPDFSAGNAYVSWSDGCGPTENFTRPTVSFSCDPFHILWTDDTSFKTCCGGGLAESTLRFEVTA